MKVLLLLVVWLGLFNSAYSKAKKSSPANIKFNNITCSFNPKVAHSFDFAISPNTNGRKFDLHWNISKVIPDNVGIGIQVFLKRGASRNLIFPYEFDFCRLWDGFMSQTIARLWFKNLKRYGKFPTSCPILKGYYALSKMQMEKGSVPPMLTGGEFAAKVIMFVNKGSNKDMLFTADLDIEIIKD